MHFFINVPNRGGYRGGGGGHSPSLTDSGRGVAPPPEFGFFCSYFQNSLINYNV